MGNKKTGKLLAVILAGTLLGTQIPGMTVAEGAAEETEIEAVSLSETEALTVQTGAAAEEPGTETKISTEKTPEAGAAGTSAEKTDSETKESTEKTTGAGTEAEKTNPETKESTEKIAGAGPAGTSAEKTDSETKESTEKTTGAGTEGTSAGETDSESETSTEKNAEAGPEGTDEDETDSETETSTEKMPDSDAETETDEAVTKVQAMIDALPSVSEVEQMTKDEQNAIYNQAQDIADAYFDELTEEQQGQVDLKKLMDLMNFFNRQVSTMASSGNGWELDDNGVLTITSREGLISFWGNANIQSIIIGSGVDGSIGEDAFYNCSSLESVTIEQGANITSIGAYAFHNCKKLKSVTVESGATIGSIGAYAFQNCSALDSVTLPSGLTSIGAYAFDSCTGLTSITIPGSVESIGNYAFRDCSKLKGITIPGSVTSIGAYAFNSCTGLTSITISKGVESIGADAFENCTGLTSITIPDSVTSIGDTAFSDCSSLTKVTLPATAPSVGLQPFWKLWNQINFIIPETSIGTGNGQYNLNAIPWKWIVILNGSSLIRSVAVTLTEPKVGSVLPASASCTTTGVENGSVSWTLDGSTVSNGAKAEYGKSYTAGITLTALTSTDTTATAQSYRFVDGISATLNGAAVTATVSDSGKTLKISKNYQMKQSQNSPNISIDYQNETLNTTVSMEYSTDEGESWTTCSADMKAADLGWDGTEKAVQIRMKETEDAYASDPVSVSIPARPAITVSQTTISTTASSLTVSASVSGISEGVSPVMKYQLVADGGNVDENNWQGSGAFMNLKAGTAYTAYAKCEATTSSFASSVSQTVSTSAAAYTVSIPSKVKAGDSTGKAEISVDLSGGKAFDLGYNGQVQVKVQSGGAVSAGGVLTLTRQDASDTLTSAMYVNETEFTNIEEPVATFTMSNYTSDDAKVEVSFAQPQPAGTQTVIPAGTYSGTVNFVVSYGE